MTSFSHLWGCEWTPSKAALWHLLVVKTLWDARGGYRFRSAANARSTQPRRYVLGRRVFATRAVRVPRCTTPSKRIHQVLQYHLITRFFSSRLTYFRAKTNTPRRREEKRRARVFFVSDVSTATTHFAFFSVLLFAQKKTIIWWLEQKRTTRQVWP